MAKIKNPYPYLKMMNDGLRAAPNLHKTQFKSMKKVRKALGKVADQCANVAMGRRPPAHPIDRVVNARAKGIVFKRIGGRIVPMRKK